MNVRLKGIVLLSFVGAALVALTSTAGIGASCTVVASKGFSKHQEMNWCIQIIRSSTGVMAGQKVICLIGVA